MLPASDRLACALATQPEIERLITDFTSQPCQHDPTQTLHDSRADGQLSICCVDILIFLRTSGDRPHGCKARWDARRARGGGLDVTGGCAGQRQLRFVDSKRDTASHHAS
jgi:hypothetical protein